MSPTDDYSRRDFLSGLFARVRRAEEKAPELPAGQARRKAFPVHRPPGAIPEEEFLGACTRCGDCIEACPHDAIVIGSARLRGSAGTPVIEADLAPCRMCADVPCIGACGDRALLPDAALVMATATIEPWACLAHQGTFCTVCHEQCPVPGATTIENGRPEIIADACTGCGVCRFVCPAPENAILLMPLLDRPPVAPRTEGES